MVSPEKNLFLAYFRRQRGLTIAKLAELTGLDRNLVSQFERGRTIPRPDELQKLADALNYSPGHRLLKEITVVIPEDDGPAEVSK